LKRRQEDEYFNQFTFKPNVSKNLKENRTYIDDKDKNKLNKIICPVRQMSQKQQPNNMNIKNLRDKKIAPCIEIDENIDENSFGSSSKENHIQILRQSNKEVNVFNKKPIKSPIYEIKKEFEGNKITKYSITIDAFKTRTKERTERIERNILNSLNKSINKSRSKSKSKSRSRSKSINKRNNKLLVECTEHNLNFSSVEDKKANINIANAINIVNTVNTANTASFEITNSNINIIKVNKNEPIDLLKAKEKKKQYLQNIFHEECPFTPNILSNSRRIAMNNPDNHKSVTDRLSKPRENYSIDTKITTNTLNNNGINNNNGCIKSMSPILSPVPKKKESGMTCSFLLSEARSFNTQQNRDSSPVFRKRSPPQVSNASITSAVFKNQTTNPSFENKDNNVGKDYKKSKDNSEMITNGISLETSPKVTENNRKRMENEKNKDKIKDYIKNMKMKNIEIIYSAIEELNFDITKLTNYNNFIKDTIISPTLESLKNDQKEFTLENFSEYAISLMN